MCPEENRFATDAAWMAQTFWPRVTKDPAGCMIWQGSTNNGGYGCITPAWKQKLYAHRLAYIERFGPVPDGLEIDHLCRVPACVNPAHLEAVTHAENIRRGASPLRDRDRCGSGHLLTPDNIYWGRWYRDGTARGASRRCRRCMLDAQRRYRDRRRALLTRS